MPERPDHTQSYYIKTFGCQMNVADSERMSALLAERGMSAAETASDADVIIINGCSVREKAVHKAVSALGELQELKRGERRRVIGLGGCVGQLAGQKLFKRAPYLDFVFGTDAIDNLPELIHRVQSGERHVAYTDFDPSMNYSTETKIHVRRAQAYVNIMKGCDKYCTYCIVPFTRGREKSRKIAEVVDDVARLVALGVREVTLLGQNVNSFGKGNENVAGLEPRDLHNVIGKVGPRAGEENFPQLLRALDRDPRCAELKLIRFTSSHPLDFSDELIECYARPKSDGAGGVSRLAPHLHLPVQSGSNRILQKMGRHHRIEDYVAQMDRLRELAPEVALSTDLIVGFPTETEEDFEATLALLDRVQYDNIYAFAYSPRPGTRATKMADDVADEVKNARLNRLLQYQLKIAEKRYAARVGREMEILVEGEAKNQNLASKSVAGWSLAGGSKSVAGGSKSVAGGSKSVAGGSKSVAGGSKSLAGGSKSLAGGSVAGGSVAGGSVAGGSVAGGSVAGGSVAGGSVAGGSVAAGADRAGLGRRVWTGRTGCNRVVNFATESPREMTGRFARVKIVGATSLSLVGEIIEERKREESA